MGPTAENQPVLTSSPTLRLIHAAFVLTGVVTTLLGPILPVLTARWSLNDAQAGYLFAAQFLGSMAGVALSSFLVPRRGYQRSLVVGLATMAGGVGTLAIGGWSLGLASVFGYGIGLGITIPTANLFIAGANPGRRAAALNLLNLAWGVGAISWPALASFFFDRDQFRAPLLGLSLALGAASIGIAYVPFVLAERGIKQARSLPKLDGPRTRQLALLLGALFFLYVGTENALGGWVASYAERFGNAPRSGWMLTPSAFWGALLLGRAAAPSVLRHLSESAHGLAGLVMATLGVSVLLITDAFPVMITGAALAGFGLAPVFPFAVSILSEHYGSLATRVGGAAFAMGGLGGATLPWLVGFQSAQWGSLKTGLLVPLVATLAMIGLHLCSGRVLPVQVREAIARTPRM
ncbi:MAG: MFS transporter [Terriglobales bacterium]